MVNILKTQVDVAGSGQQINWSGMISDSFLYRLLANCTSTQKALIAFSKISRPLCWNTLLMKFQTRAIVFDLGIESKLVNMETHNIKYF